MPRIFASKGIIHQTSCNETTQQNAIVEIKRDHILNIGRVLLFQYNLPKTFWSFAVIHVVFTINRVLSFTLDNHSPYFLIHQNLPNLNDLKNFGSLIFALQNHKTKLSSGARKCIFFSDYQVNMKGAVLYEINNKETLVFRDITHHESIFPYQPGSKPSARNYCSTTLNDNHNQTIDLQFRQLSFRYIIIY